MTAWIDRKRAAGSKPGLGKLSRWVRAGVPLPADLENAPLFERQLVSGELAFRRGDWREAIDLLQDGLEGLLDKGQLMFFEESESLATAWQQIGEDARALEVLEEAAQVEPLFDFVFFTGASGRFRVRARLADEYRKLGRIDEAVAIEDDVLHMLQFADADHPVVLQIKEARSATSVETAAQ